VEREPTAAELAQQQARVSQLKLAETRQAANLNNVQGALDASAALAGQALEGYSVAVRALQSRQLTEQITQDALTQAQQTVDDRHRDLGQWARQAYQGGTGLASNATLNMFFQAQNADDVATDLVVLRRVGRDRGLAMDAVEQAQKHANTDADAAANASQDAADAAIKASSTRDAADQAVNTQRQRLGLAESALSQTQTDSTAAVRKQADLQAASALAQARRADASASSAASNGNRVTGPVGSCIGGAVEQYPNGAIPLSALCPLWGATGQYLRADAAFAYGQLSHSYAVRFGAPICITDSYRSYASQVDLFARKPGLAAVPGTSNHGWGTAVDLCGGIESFGTVQHEWMLVNAPLYGWFHPSWAEPTGSRPEPWHWEFGG
jgi:hypothetical protein